MNWSNVVTVYLKELRDQLRDRRTLLSMFIIPTLGMPLLMLGIAFIAVNAMKQVRSETPAVMLLGAAESPQVRAALAAYDKVQLVPAADDYRARISAKTLRAAIELPDDYDARLAAGEQVALSLYFYQGEVKSGSAADRVRDFFEDRGREIAAARLKERGLPEAFTKPVDVQWKNVAPPEKVGGAALGGMIPYLFILLCFTGAMYPAMDLTAGEKERGTMETILCSSVARVELVIGKFLMVLTASLGTVVSSLLAMTVTTFTLVPLLFGDLLQKAAASGGGGPSFAISPLGLLAALGLVLPLAVLFSAVLMSVSLFAKNYKEAQSYASPLIFAVIMPAVLGMLPGIELKGVMTFIPIVNVTLLSKELVSGTFPWGQMGLIFGSTCVYAGLALAWCVRMFNREDVIFRT